MEKFRELALENVRIRGVYRCQRCGWDFAPNRLEVHHKNYKRLGRETLVDVLVLCQRCHEKGDAKRAKQGRQNGEMALHDARLDGWAQKKSLGKIGKIRRAMRTLSKNFGSG